MADELRKSRRTVQRALSDLEGAGVISRVQDMRDGGGNGSNFTVILPYVEDGVTKDDAPNVIPSVSYRDTPEKPRHDEDDGTFFEATSLNSFKALSTGKEKEEDIYKPNHARVRVIALSALEEYIKDKGIKLGFSIPTLDDIILELRRVESTEYTYADVDAAFDQFLKEAQAKVSRGETFISVPRYFARTVVNVVRGMSDVRRAIALKAEQDAAKEAAEAERRRQEIERDRVMYPNLYDESGFYRGYNWLEDDAATEPDTYDELIKQARSQGTAQPAGNRPATITPAATADEWSAIDAEFDDTYETRNRATTVPYEPVYEPYAAVGEFGVRSEYEFTDEELMLGVSFAPVHDDMRFRA